MSQQTIETSSLANHIRNNVYENYKTNRQNHENRWTRNRASANADPALDEFGVFKKSERAEDWQSDTMIDVVRQKIVAAKSIISDTAFKGSKVQFMLVAANGDEKPETPEESAIDANRDEVLVTNERYLNRQLDNSDAVSELGRCVLSGATYGRYFAKRYTSKMRNNGFEPVAENVYIENQTESDTMAFENKSVFSMFWDMETDDLINGEAVIETDWISAWDLRKDATKPFHFLKQIMLAIKSGDKENNALSDDDTAIPQRLRDIAVRTKTIHKIEFWGRVPRKKAEQFEAMIASGEEIEPVALRNNDDPEFEQGDMVEIFAILADDYIIAYHRTNDPNERPYYMEDWEEVLDGNCGRSIADNLASITKVLNGATRTLEDNVKLTSKLILALKRSGIKENIEEQMSSDKAIITFTLDEEDRNSIQDIIQQIKIDPIMDQLSALVTMYLDFADMASSMPRIEQGQESDNPSTAFEIQQRLSRSGKYMGEIIKRLDKFIEKIINDFYKYNMLDPDLPIAKGVYKIKALGFSSFENQIIRLQALMRFFALVADRPDLMAEIDARWLVEEIAKAIDLDPEQLFKSEEQKAREAEAQQNSPEVQEQQLQLQKLQQELVNLQSDTSANQANQADIAKKQADIEKIQHDMMIAEEQLKLDRATAVQKIKTDRATAAKGDKSQ